MKTLTLIVLPILFLFSRIASAQPPNDNCPSAFSLTTSCTTVTNGSAAAATESIPSVNCNGFASPAANDVWYQFTGLNATPYSIVVAPSSGMDVVVELRYGACSSQSSVACSDYGFTGETETLNFTAAATGVYYIRVYPYSSPSPTTYTFTICVTTSIGIEEVDNGMQFAVFPNPIADILNLKASKTINNAALTIYNSLGLKVFSDNVSVNSNQPAELKLNQPAGVYFLEIKNETKRYTQKLIIE
jgi:hypothetical protein